MTTSGESYLAPLSNFTPLSKRATGTSSTNLVVHPISFVADCNAIFLRTRERETGTYESGKATDERIAATNDLETRTYGLATNPRDQHQARTNRQQTRTTPKQERTKQERERPCQPQERADVCP
jgi:hypothetical protein